MPTKQGSHEEEILVSEGMLTIRTREQGQWHMGETAGPWDTHTYTQGE